MDLHQGLLCTVYTFCFAPCKSKVKPCWIQTKNPLCLTPEFCFRRYNLPVLVKSLQLNHSPVDCDRELFKLWNDSVSLVVCNEKIFFKIWVFCGWRHKWGMFRHFWPRLSGPGSQPHKTSISLTFLVQTRLKSHSFEPLNSFLVFLVQKLWPKCHKMDTFTKNCHPQKTCIQNIKKFFHCQLEDSQSVLRVL